MKTPCEIVVWYVLPTIRREIAKEMVDTYHMKQADDTIKRIEAGLDKMKKDDETWKKIIGY